MDDEQVTGPGKDLLLAVLQDGSPCGKSKLVAPPLEGPSDHALESNFGFWQAFRLREPEG